MFIKEYRNADSSAEILSIEELWRDLHPPHDFTNLSSCSSADMEENKKQQKNENIHLYVGLLRS